MVSEEVINPADFGTQNTVEAAEGSPGETKLDPGQQQEQELDSPLDC